MAYYGAIISGINTIMTDKKTLLEFPCLFPVKIIGTNGPAFQEEVHEIVLKHFPDFDKKDLNSNASKNNQYIAITVTVFAINQEMLDAFYQEITKHPDMKMVL